MNKVLIAALAVSTMAISGAAFAAEAEESYLRDSIVADIDAEWEIENDITDIDYTDQSLDISGNDLMSHNRSTEVTSVEVDDSFTSISHDTTTLTRIDVVDNDGFNDIEMRTDNVVAVNVGDTVAVYSYRPDNASFAANQNDFGDLHKISVSAVGAMAGPSISVGRAVER